MPLANVRGRRPLKRISVGRQESRSEISGRDTPVEFNTSPWRHTTMLFLSPRRYVIAVAILPLLVFVACDTSEPQDECPCACKCDTEYKGPANGNWNDALNWTNGVPTAEKGACIPTGTSVLLDVESTSAKCIEVKGRVTATTAKAQSLKASGDICIREKGEVEDLAFVESTEGAVVVDKGGKVTTISKGSVTGTRIIARNNVCILGTCGVREGSAGTSDPGSNGGQVVLTSNTANVIIGPDGVVRAGKGGPAETGRRAGNGGSIFLEAPRGKVDRKRGATLTPGAAGGEEAKDGKVSPP